MKKCLALSLLLLLVFATIGFAGEDTDDEGFYEPDYGSEYGPSVVKKPFFMELGAAYSLEMLDINDLTFNVKPVGHEVDFADSWGIQGRIGYQITEIFAVEGGLEWINGYKWEGSYNFYGVPSYAQIEVNVQFVTLCARLMPPIGQLYWFRPYLIFGPGFMNVQVNSDARFNGVPKNYTETETHPMGKAGFGMDFYLNESMSVGIEGYYCWGMQEVDEVQFTNIAVLTGVHF
ncbi:MAG: outer membrane beta-barrel protein [Thermodesulfobacteriota bacterium]